MIPLVRPLFPNEANILMNFSESLMSGAISNFGPCFNKVVAKLHEINGRHNLPCVTGTHAIELAVKAHFKRGSRIVIPDYTHVGTLQAVVSAGCEPILAPVSKATWTLNESFIHCIPESEYDGFIVVSPFGYRVNFEGYDYMSQAMGKPVIYDLAGAWGMAIDTENTVCFSLHGTKNLSCGEGGIVSFAKEEDFIRAKRLSNFDTLPDRTVASPYGNNLKPDELKCAVLLAHLDAPLPVAERIGFKRALIDYYQTELKSLCIPHDLHIGNTAPSLCVLSGLNAEFLERMSVEVGVTMKQYYPLLSSMAGLEDVRRFGKSSQFFRTCIALPSDVSWEEAEKVVETIKRLDKVRGAVTVQNHP